MNNYHKRFPFIKEHFKDNAICPFCGQKSQPTESGAFQLFACTSCEVYWDRDWDYGQITDIRRMKRASEIEGYLWMALSDPYPEYDEG